MGPRATVYILHSVTLGATGKPTQGTKRHPSVGDHVTLGAGATILGDVYVGNGATVGASAVVTRDVPAGGVVVGVNKLANAPAVAAKPTTASKARQAAREEPRARL